MEGRRGEGEIGSREEKNHLETDGEEDEIEEENSREWRSGRGGYNPDDCCTRWGGELCLSLTGFG